MYTENYKTLVKEIKDNINRWRDIPFLGRKNQYCENGYSTKGNLQIQCNPYQITNGIFTELGQKLSQFLWKHRRPRIAKAVLTKKNGAGGIQIILQSYSHQDSMVLAQKQKYRPMEKDRNAKNKPMHLCVPYFWQRRQEYTMGQGQPLQ